MVIRVLENRSPGRYFRLTTVAGICVSLSSTEPTHSLSAGVARSAASLANCSCSRRHPDTAEAISPMCWEVRCSYVAIAWKFDG